MSESRLAQLQAKLHDWHRKHFDWLLENLASPIAPQAWLARLRPASAPARWMLEAAKGILVIVWAVAGVGIWFLVLWVLILWETFTPSERPRPPAPASHG